MSDSENYPLKIWNKLFERKQISAKGVSLFKPYAAPSQAGLQMPPGNRLEALKGDRTGRHIIRINNQYRICFRWTDAGAEDVEIVDYH